MHVASILSAKGVEVALATPDTTTREAVARLRDRGIGALVVSSDGVLQLWNPPPLPPED